MTRADTVAQAAAATITACAVAAAVALGGFLWATVQVTLLVLFTMGGAS
jgi:hypothetical protein